MKTIFLSLFTLVISPITFVIASESRINSPLNADQLEFVQKHAPYFLAPTCNMDGYDNFCKVDFDGDWNADNNYTTTSDKNKYKALKNSPVVIYFDYYETLGFIIVNYMAYRPWNEVSGPTFGGGNHLHDTESVNLIFRKQKERSTYEIGIEAANPQPIILVTNSSGESVKTAIDQENLKFIGKNSLAVQGYFGLSGMSDYLGSPTYIFKTASKDEARPLVLTKANDHRMYPIFDIQTAKDKLNNSSTVILNYKDSVGADAALDDFKNARQFKYDLIELAPIINDSEKAKTLVLGGILPKDPASQDCTQTTVCQKDLRGDLIENGKAGEANLSYAWSVTDFGNKEKPSSKKDGARYDLVRTPMYLKKGFPGLCSEEQAVPVRIPYWEAVAK